MDFDYEYFLNCRMQEFLEKQETDPLEGVAVWNDNVVYRLLVLGPEDSPYAGGLFTCRLHIDTDSPKYCRVVFLMRIAHPNIDAEGRLQTELVVRERILDYELVLKSVRTALIEPVVDGACNAALAALYSSDRQRYNAVVREATLQSAY